MSTLDSLNPATEQIVGQVVVTPVGEVSQIVDRARVAQVAWAARSYEERAAILRTAGQALVERANELGTLATQEMGKPVAQAQGEARYVAKSFDSDLTEIGAALKADVFTDDSVQSTVYHDPFGVVACISPWNFPVLMPHQQVLPALAAGNAVVFKPSEQTPLTGQSYADALIDVLPPDVLQVVHGADEQGKALVAAAVDLIVFTGSREAGKHILAAASQGLKRVILELGGKDPLIVLDDADVAAAAKFATRNSFRNAGQVCVSTERIYALPAIADQLVAAMTGAASAMKLGNGMDDGVDIGPMVNAAQRDHVRAQIRDAVEQGATVAWHGEELGGNFIAPVILTGVTHDMRIATEETFGPVACFIAVVDEADAIRKANDTPFGLGAVVFGARERAHGVARQLNAGMIGVNQGLGSAGGTPWVGARESGYGFHSGHDGHRQFTQARVISLGI